jgi:hypothetical protein
VITCKILFPIKTLIKKSGTIFLIFNLICFQEFFVINSNNEDSF